MRREDKLLHKRAKPAILKSGRSRIGAIHPEKREHKKLMANSQPVKTKTQIIIQNLQVKNLQPAA